MGLTGIPPAAFMRGGNPADPRSVRTRRQLLDAYERLLNSGMTPTVAELVREAGVSRSSFYGHFTGIEEVGVASLRSILDEFEPLRRASASPAQASTAAGFLDLFAHLNEHRVLCGAVLTSGEHVPALAELHGVLVRHLTLALAASPAKPAGFDAAQGATFLVGGMLSLLVESLQRTGVVDRGTLGDTVAAMLPQWLTEANVLQEALPVTLNASSHR